MVFMLVVQQIERLDMDSSEAVKEEQSKINENAARPGRFVLDLKKSGLADRHPTQIWRFDQAIRRWTAESARSSILVY